MWVLKLKKAIYVANINNYIILPIITSFLIQVYCDVLYDVGGWILVGLIHKHSIDVICTREDKYLPTSHAYTSE